MPSFRTQQEVANHVSTDECRQGSLISGILLGAASGQQAAIDHFLFWLVFNHKLLADPAVHSAASATLSAMCFPDGVCHPRPPISSKITSAPACQSEDFLCLRKLASMHVAPILSTTLPEQPLYKDRALRCRSCSEFYDITRTVDSILLCLQLLLFLT